MAKFKYRMQSILNVKMKLEVQAKQEFASAQAALSREEEKLILMKPSIKELQKLQIAYIVVNLLLNTHLQKHYTVV